MAFWKKSEDPWDWDPSKKRPAPQPAEPQEPRENPLDTLKQWNEDRKAKAREKEEARRLPPEKCPWCGKDMEQGFLVEGRDSVRWYSGVFKRDFLRGVDGSAIPIINEGSLWGGYYKTTWLCRACKKAVFDMPDPPEVYDPFAAPAEDEETKEEEESGN